MQGMTLDYFKVLFEAGPSLNAAAVVSLFGRVITDEMSDKLCEPFSDKEIGDAMFQIGPLKAPWPDGFPARFFQRHWAIFKDDIVVAVDYFLRQGICQKV